MSPPPLHVLDLFAGSGIRSMRYLVHAGADQGEAQVDRSGSKLAAVRTTHTQGICTPRSTYCSAVQRTRRGQPRLPRQQPAGCSSGGRASGVGACRQWRGGRGSGGGQMAAGRGGRRQVLHSAVAVPPDRGAQAPRNAAALAGASVRRLHVRCNNRRPPPLTAHPIPRCAAALTASPPPIPAPSACPPA